MTDKIDYIINQTTNFENEKTNKLFKLTGVIKSQGFLNKNQAIKILKWKSPRPLRFYEQNSEEEIVAITRLALKQKDDNLKIHILTALKGVNYPSASAILMFYEPLYYPVIDIRVWKQLYKNNLVFENPRGQNFSLSQWSKYLDVIRKIGHHYNLTARQVEKRLFDFDKLTQSGNLYN